ncbi:MAG: hypothetical protein UX96_C0011G0001, partial [Candidatus Wolfebacteria bacterium GW2011_GWB1_47_243]
REGKLKERKRECRDDLYEWRVFWVKASVELGDIAVAGRDMSEFVHNRRLLLRGAVHQYKRSRKDDRQNNVLSGCE